MFLVNLIFIWKQFCKHIVKGNSWFFILNYILLIINKNISYKIFKFSLIKKPIIVDVILIPKTTKEFRKNFIKFSFISFLLLFVFQNCFIKSFGIFWLWFWKILWFHCWWIVFVNVCNWHCQTFLSNVNSIYVTKIFIYWKVTSLVILVFINL